MKVNYFIVLPKFPRIFQKLPNFQITLSLNYFKFDLSMGVKWWFARNLLIPVTTCATAHFIPIVQLPISLNQKTKDKKMTQPEITCSKLTIETVEQGVKYVQS